ncbi:MAG: acylphosphatase [Candidatus Omnitrophica bacterium]|nr:acylphosphatase [Candidatus Omnitrophota bacterium]
MKKDDPSSGRERMQVFFSGTVQGVGFRFTAERLARRFPVEGFVRNLDDGRVEVVAEGGREALTGFLTAIRESGMKPYIREVESFWSDPQHTFSGFKVTY